MENETNQLVKPGFLDGIISCLCLVYVQEFFTPGLRIVFSVCETN